MGKRRAISRGVIATLPAIVADRRVVVKYPYGLRATYDESYLP